MKTNYLFIVAIIMASFCWGCSEDLPSINEDSVKEALKSGEITTEYVRVRSIGTVVHALDGGLILEFPPGTVPTPTRYKIVSFPIEYLLPEGTNVMMRAITITNITNESKMAHPVKFIMRYDLCRFNECQPHDKSDLAVYHLLGDRHAFHGVKSTGECCMDCSCKTISGCIQECGTYVVCENQQ